MNVQHCVRDKDEWCPCEPKSLVRHRPTHTTFEVYADPALGPEQQVGLDEFRWRLIHVCEGHPHPPPEAQALLGREAIVMCLYYLGWVRLIEIKNPPDAQNGAPSGAEPQRAGGQQ
jgi:hypothetical protein